MNRLKRRHMSKVIAAKLKAGIVPEGGKVAITVETQEKGDDILKMICEIIPDARDRWTFVIVPVGGKEKTVH